MDAAISSTTTDTRLATSAVTTPLTVGGSRNAKLAYMTAVNVHAITALLLEAQWSQFGELNENGNLMVSQSSPAVNFVRSHTTQSSGETTNNTIKNEPSKAKKPCVCATNELLIIE
jgi:hypothetical protein